MQKKQIRLYQPQLILLDNFTRWQRDRFNSSYRQHQHTGRVFHYRRRHMDTISDALRMGVFDYLIKPVHYQRLQHTTRQFRGTAVRYVPVN